jgi:hypothetical protein
VSKRTDYLFGVCYDLSIKVRKARDARNNIRDNYAEILASAQGVLAALKDELDERLARLNQLRALETPPLGPLTLADFRPDTANPPYPIDPIIDPTLP